MNKESKSESPLIGIRKAQEHWKHKKYDDMDFSDRHSAYISGFTDGFEEAASQGYHFKKASRTALIGERSAEEILQLKGIQFPASRSPRDYNLTLIAMEEYASQFKVKEDSLPEATEQDKRILEGIQHVEAVAVLDKIMGMLKDPQCEIASIIHFVKKAIVKVESKEDNKAFGEQDLKRCWEAARDYDRTHYLSFDEWRKINIPRKPE